MIRLARRVFYAETRWTFGIERNRTRLFGNFCRSEKRCRSLAVTNFAYGRTVGSISPFLLCSGLFTLFQKKTDPDSELITIIKRGILLWQRGDMKKSEQMFHIALKLAQEQQNHDGVVYVLDNLANLAYETDQYDKAHKLFVSVLQHLMGAGVSEDDNRIIHISLKLADIYHKTGEESKAEQGYKYCLEKVESKVTSGVEDEDTLLLLALTSDWYAQFVLDQERFKDAYSLLKKAHDTLLKLKEPNNSFLVSLLEELGVVSYAVGDLDNAVRYFKEGISLGKKISEVNDLGSMYVYLGFTYIRKQMFEEAKRACSDGRNLAQVDKRWDLKDEAQKCLDDIKKFQKAQV